MKATQARMDFLCKVLPDGYQIVPNAAISVLFDKHRDAYMAFISEMSPGGFSWEDWERLYPTKQEAA
jgi:hypothetical protein